MILDDTKAHRGGISASSFLKPSLCSSLQGSSRIHLSHKPALQLSTLHSKYFTGCSLQLWVCISTIRPPCWECTSSLEQAELFLYITHLSLIFLCLISNHFWKSFQQLLNTSLSVAGMLSAQGTECKCWAEGRMLTASEHFPHWTPEGGGGKDKWQGSWRTLQKPWRSLSDTRAKYISATGPK